VEIREEVPKGNGRTHPRQPRMAHCQQTLIHRDPTMTAPVPWSLAWSEDGELAPQDLFDLLQSMVSTESSEVQPALISAVERLSVVQLSVVVTAEVTELCARGATSAGVRRQMA
jgi:hypothetical protein